MSYEFTEGDIIIQLSECQSVQTGEKCKLYTMYDELISVPLRITDEDEIDDWLRSGGGCSCHSKWKLASQTNNDMKNYVTRLLSIKQDISNN